MRARAVVGVLLVAAVSAVSAGCGGPRAYPPTGIDGLRIPTPSPRASDFVERIDNPWFPLSLRGRWVYGVQPGGQRIVTVAGHDRVAGVTTTRVVTRWRGAAGSAAGSASGESVDDYAQDRAGNVWWFAHRGAGDPGGSWQAGEAGAQAGLAVPAHPRLGDGFRMGYRPGRFEDVGQVVAVSPREMTIDVSSPLEPGAVTRLTYRRGGLALRIVAATGEIDTLE